MSSLTMESEGVCYLLIFLIFHWFLLFFMGFYFFNKICLEMIGVKEEKKELVFFLNM